MSSTQRVVLILGALAVTLVCLYPPWEYIYATTSSFRPKPGPYAWVFSPPPPLLRSQGHPFAQPRVAVGLIALEAVAVSTLTAAAFLLAPAIGGAVGWLRTRMRGSKHRGGV